MEGDLLPYYLIFAVSAMLGFVDVLRVKALGTRGPNVTAISFTALVLVIVALSALRLKTGTDWPAYEQYYYNGDTSWEPLFTLLNQIFHGLGFPFFILTGVVAVFVVSTRVMLFSRYSPAIFVSLFFYITNILFLRDFSNLKQAIASAILIIATHAIIQRKLWKFIALVLLASQFHLSAIAFLIAYFVPARRYSTPVIVALFTLSLVVGQTTIFFEILTGFVSLFTGFDSRIISKIARYLSYSDAFSAGSILIPTLKKVVILATFLFFRRSASAACPEYERLLNLVVFGYVVFNILGNPALEQLRRVVTYFDAYECILAGAVIAGTRTVTNAIGVYVVLVVMSWGKLFGHIDRYSAFYLPFRSIFGG